MARKKKKQDEYVLITLLKINVCLINASLGNVLIRRHSFESYYLSFGCAAQQHSDVIIVYLRGNLNPGIAEAKHSIYVFWEMGLYLAWSRVVCAIFSRLPQQLWQPAPWLSVCLHLFIQNTDRHRVDSPHGSLKNKSSQLIFWFSLFLLLFVLLLFCSFTAAQQPCPSVRKWQLSIL